MGLMAELRCRLGHSHSRGGCATAHCPNGTTRVSQVTRRLLMSWHSRPRLFRRVLLNRFHGDLEPAECLGGTQAHAHQV